MGELAPKSAGIMEPVVVDGFATTRLKDLLAWAQKYSLFMCPFVTACCGMEFMGVTSPRYDLSRFGAEIPRFSPRQSDLLWVVGTITQRQATAVLWMSLLAIPALVFGTGVYTWWRKR